jgi:hypothetical protein
LQESVQAYPPQFIHLHCNKQIQAEHITTTTTTTTTILVITNHALDDNACGLLHRTQHHEHY